MRVPIGYVPEEAPPGYTEALNRVSYELGYGWDPDRTLTVGGMQGSPIANSYHPGEESDGEWDLNGTPMDNAPFRAWVLHYFRGVINESVHEALEWFKVDDKPLLNPHSFKVESEIFELTDEFAEKLWALVEQSDFRLTETKESTT